MDDLELPEATPPVPTPGASTVFPTPTRIQKVTGPTLRDELAAAGLQDAPVSIVPEAYVEVDPSVDAKTLKAIKTVVTSHDASKALVVHATECFPAQGEIALYQTGHYEAYQTAVANSAYVPLKIYVQKASKWELSNPYIQAMQAELGLSDDEVQALFDLAVTL